MYIDFKYIKFKNLNSYGNSYTYFEFENGFNLISGKNGQGKSSIIDALCFVLYGVPYRKINIKDLINRKNKKNLVVNTKFIIGNDTYEITRGIKPDILEIKKNDLELDLLHSKKLIQEEIEKIINVNLVLFKNIISLSINYNKPFLSLTQPEKRDIIENIFNIKIFGFIVKQLKTNNTTLKTDFKLNKSNLTYLEDSLKSLKENLRKLEVEQDSYTTQKNKELDNILNQYKSTFTKIKNSTKNISILKQKIEQENIKLLPENSNLESLNSKIIQGNFEIKNLNKDKSFLDSNDVCSVCKSDITPDHKNKHLSDIDSKLKKIKKSLDKYQIEYTEGKQIQESNKILKESIRKLDTDIRMKSNDVSIYTDELTRLKKLYKDKKNQTVNFNIFDLKSEFDSKKESYKELHSKTKSIKEELDINENIFNILGEDGIKSYFLSKLIPILNKKINDNTNYFDIPISIEFDNLMNEKINSIVKNESIDYMSFSEGEKKRIDISILLSFLEMTKLISNFSTNLLFFDELLDSSTDESGLEKIIKLIKQNFKKSMCIYVITHRNNDYEFDNVYTIEKRDSFSHIVKG
jgi:DNA repair exonuclease SbcCD ATPase subunit